MYLVLFRLSSVIMASVGSGEKTLQEYPVNAGLPRGSIVGPTLF